MRFLSLSLLTAMLAVLFVCSGCSPKVYTTIQKSYPERVESSPVLVYSDADTLPAKPEQIGTIHIEDQRLGYSSLTSFIQTAKIEANKTGGNAIQFKPFDPPSSAGIGSRIAADILILSDSVSQEVLFQNKQTEKIIVTNYADRFRQNRSNDKSIYQNKRKFNGFHIHMGYSTMLTDFHAQQYYAMEDYKSGFGINAGYQWVSRIGIGVGVRYVGFFSSFKEKVIRHDYVKNHLDFSSHYIAPEFVAFQKFGDKWFLHESIGCGFGGYFEPLKKVSKNASGFGGHIEAGFKYRIKHWLGVGANVMAHNIWLSSSDTQNQLFIKERFGKRSHSLTFLSFSGGISFYVF